MSKKITYEELEEKVKKLEKENTESKRVDELLSESEDKYRSRVDRTNDGIVLIKEIII
jgi:hypothetical protein